MHEASKFPTLPYFHLWPQKYVKTCLYVFSIKLIHIGFHINLNIHYCEFFKLFMDDKDLKIYKPYTIKETEEAQGKNGKLYLSLYTSDIHS